MWLICVLVVVGVIRKIRLILCVLNRGVILLYFFGGRFISSMLLILVFMQVLVKCLQFMIFIGFRYFISIIGVVLLLWWNLVIMVSMLCRLVLVVRVCLQVFWIIGLLVIGLENGMFSLIMLVFVFIMVCIIGMVIVLVGLLVVM